MRCLTTIAAVRSRRSLYPWHSMPQAASAAAGYVSTSLSLPSRAAGAPHTSSAQRRCSSAHRIATEPSLSAETDSAARMPCCRMARSVSRCVSVDRSTPPGHGRNEPCASTASTKAAGHPSGESTPTTSTVRTASTSVSSSRRPLTVVAVQALASRATRTTPVALASAARSMPRTSTVMIMPEGMRAPNAHPNDG